MGHVLKTNRRRFVGGALAGGLVAGLPRYCYASEKKRADYARLDEILEQPVLRKELFTAPVIIETLELLRATGQAYSRYGRRCRFQKLSSAA